MSPLKTVNRTVDEGKNTVPTTKHDDNPLQVSDMKVNSNISGDDYRSVPKKQMKGSSDWVVAAPTQAGAKT